MTPAGVATIVSAWPRRATNPSRNKFTRPDTRLGRHMMLAVDGRIGNKSAATALDVYSSQDHVTPAFTRNPNFWGADIIASLTCASPSNSATDHLEAVTAITRRHLLCIKHGAGYPADSSTVRFVTTDNTIVSRTILQHVELSDDMAVMLIDSDLPASITPCKVVADDIITYLNSCVNIPLLKLDQEEKGLVVDMKNIYDGGITLGTPCTAKRREFYEDAVAGDSGNPMFGIINGEFVLFAVTNIDGPSPAGLNDAINTAIGDVDALGAVTTGYTVTNPSMTKF
jgi:hypothetical protein